MLDINDFIEARGGNPEKIRESQRRRGAPVEVVDQIIALFENARKTQYEATQIGAKINGVQKEIGQKKKAKEDASELLQQKIDLEKKKKEQEALAAEKHAELLKVAKTVGNYIEDSVPVAMDEAENKVERTWGDDKKKPKAALSHHEVMYRLGAYDPERGVKLVGHRGYCLTGMGFFLNQALINYGVQFLYGKGYIPNQPPFFMNKEQMAKTAQLSQFDEELYKVSEGGAEGDKYLIATSEQPLSAAHSSEWLQERELPIRYAGYSTNFRKEAGSHGRDAWGTFRVHQFEKVEQFVLCKPEESAAEFGRMMSTSEEFYQSLGLPYQVVSIVSGAFNNSASKKQDLEAWFPFQQEYKELVSCSNCTDYQTRELEIRYGVKKAKISESERKQYVHALNATLTATQRTLCAILETYQTEDGTGITVPEVLRPFIPGQPDFLPFTKELPQDEKEKQAKIKQEKTKQAALPQR